jgi:hypothetical protein
MQMISVLIAINDGLQTFFQFAIPGIVSVIVVMLTNRATHRDKRESSRTDIYKSELEQMNRQREMVNQENTNLRDALKSELDDCREQRQSMDEYIVDLKHLNNTQEAELFAWRNGLKTPIGYVLVRLPLADEPPPTRAIKRKPRQTHTEEDT